MMGGVLDRESILAQIRPPQPLVEEYLDLSAQLQPNGFDLTLKEVSQFTSRGETGPLDGPASLSTREALPFDAEGRVDLSSGTYMVTLNEIVNLPLNIMALARPRSSLLRSGVAIHTAVWDAGYRGRSQVLMVVGSPYGYRLVKGARLLQMVFLYLTAPLEEGYKGRFHGENI